MHLSSLRYQLLLDAALRSQSGEKGLVAFRKEASEQFTEICYMGLLWETFRNLVFGWLDELELSIGFDTLRTIKNHLEGKIDEFIDVAFEIDFNSQEVIDAP